MDSYKIKMRINTLSAFVNQAMNIATVDVKVLDKNDNTPRYVEGVPNKTTPKI